MLRQCRCVASVPSPRWILTIGLQQAEVILAIEHVGELFSRLLRQAYGRQTVDDRDRPSAGVPDHPILADLANGEAHAV